MNYIEPKEGTVYDPAHLRQAKSVEELLSLARQGHPLAWAHNGGEVNVIIEVCPKSYVFSCWDNLLSMWVLRPRGEKKLMKYLRLAPLAVKDGKPLHVGDVIETAYADVDTGNTCWRKESASLGHGGGQVYGFNPSWWRWPVEVKK